MAHRILVADDDPHIREVICFALAKAGMVVTSAVRDGAEALGRFTADAPDLVILDIGMPEIDGLEVCRQIRRTSNVPILFLSARDEEIDHVLGLEIGADDYVTKPFSPRELVARVNVIMRRLGPDHTGGAQPQGRLVRGDVELDVPNHGVEVAGRPITLTAIEFAILKTLLGRPGMIFTRDQIMSVAYDGHVHVSDRTIDSHIRNVRAKFAAVGCSGVVDTVHGVGFRAGRCERAQP